MHNMKQYMNIEDKTKFQKELMDQIFKQLRDFLKKKAAVPHHIFLEGILNHGTQFDGERKLESDDRQF